MVVESTNQAALGTPKTHTLPRQLPKTPQKVFKPHWVSCGAKADNVRIPCTLKPSPSPSPPVRPQHLQPQPQAQQVQATPPQPPARATSPQPSRAQPSPAKKCSPAQPSPAQPSPPPGQQTQTRIQKKNFRSKLSVKTFGQNFRSKLSVKTLLAPKPLTISINPKPLKLRETFLTKTFLSRISLKTFCQNLLPRPRPPSPKFEMWFQKRKPAQNVSLKNFSQKRFSQNVSLKRFSQNVSRKTFLSEPSLKTYWHPNP